MIEVSHLTKRYGNTTAVSDLSFSIEKGRIYGFLGPNGAGKSTTMNIITGCLAATEGDVKIGGFDIYDEPKKAKALIGYLPEIPPVYPDRTVREYLRFVAEAKRVPSTEINGQIEKVISVTGIADVSDRLIKVLSKGYRQRVGIAQALIGDPELIILDEPTVGLDPRQIIEIRELIKQLGKNHTVILSSHILSEVQAVCDTIMIISKGRLVACDSAENLERIFAGSTTIELKVEGSCEAVCDLLKDLPTESLKLEAHDDGKCYVCVETESGTEDDMCRRLFFIFSKAGMPILGMNTLSASLEDIFLELTSEEQAEAQAQGAEGEEAVI